MACLFTEFTGKILNTFDRAKDLTGHWNDLYLDFGGSKIVLYEPFTIPFTKRENGSLKRFNNWNKAPEAWKDIFIGRQLIKLDMSKYQNNIYLEFNGDLALLSNKELVALFYEQKCLWSTMEMEILK